MSETKFDYISCRLPFFGNLSGDEQARLLANARTVRYKKSSVIYDGSGELGLILVRRGCIYAYTVTADGREFVLMRFFSGDCCVFALPSISDDINFPIYINAENEADVIIIDPVELNFEANIAVQIFLRQQMAGHFSAVVSNMQNMMLVSAKRRIALYICGESDRMGTTRIKTTHEQIARYVGSVREVVSRTLGRLAAAGFIEIERGLVIILDKAGLRELI